MEIERINENTVKFYISYVDIENRGFEREEIWYNRERSEQLFWQMMDEVNSEEDFTVEGPLWIQVQALEKGLEIIVTKAHLSKGETADDLDLDESIDITIKENSKSLFDDKFTDEDFEHLLEDDEEDSLWMTASFNDLEDVIQLSHYFQTDNEDNLVTALYHYKDKYYLYIELTSKLIDEQEDIFSQVLEYSTESDVTSYVLDEYGTKIIEKDVFNEMKKHFSVNIK